MKTHPPFRILIIAENASLANRLISPLRQNKYPVKIFSLNKLKALRQTLQKSQADLFVIFESEDIKVKQCLAACANINNRLPTLIARSENSTFNKTACPDKSEIEVILQHDIGRLLLSIKQRLNLSVAIKARQKLARQVQILEKQQQTLLDDSPQAIAMLDQGCHCYCNDRYLLLLTGGDQEKILNKSILDLVVSKERKKLEKLISNEAIARENFIIDNTVSSENVMLTLSFAPAFFNGGKYLQVSAVPAKGNYQYSKDKESLADHDILTRLENLKSFTTSIESAISQAIESNITSSLIVVQIENFDAVQERLGKVETNKVLYEISEFLHSAITTPFTASRMADNEFGLLLHDCDSVQGIKFAEFIQKTLNGSLSTTQTLSRKISATLGMAVINNLSLDAEDMINSARISKIINTQWTLNNSSTEALDKKMPALIQQALKLNEVNLSFQPFVPFQPDDVERYDIRMRLQDENEQALYPADFLPHANLHNQAGQLDKQVLTQIFQQPNLLQGSNRHLYIHLSGNTLINRAMLSWLSKALQDSRVSAQQLIFQISEIDLHSNWRQTLLFSQSLNDLGIRQSITHFGSAMEAIPVLTAIKPESVRLDDSLIKDIIYSKQQQHKVRKLIRAIHYKDARVCISGVEDIEILPLLWDLGVDLIQGYCLQAPVNKMSYSFPKEEKLNLCA